MSKVRFRLDGRDYTGVIISPATTHSVIRFQYKTGEVQMQLNNKKLKKVQDDTTDKTN
jgi:hypothetical protein